MHYRKNRILRSWAASIIIIFDKNEWMIIPYYIHSVAASLTLGWFSMFFFIKEGVRRKSTTSFLSISLSHKCLLPMCIHFFDLTVNSRFSGKKCLFTSCHFVLVLSISLSRSTRFYKAEQIYLDNEINFVVFVFFVEQMCCFIFVAILTWILVWKSIEKNVIVLLMMNKTNVLIVKVNQWWWWWRW